MEEILEKLEITYKLGNKIFLELFNAKNENKIGYL